MSRRSDVTELRRSGGGGEDAGESESGDEGEGKGGGEDEDGGGGETRAGAQWRATRSSEECW
jgi:hypothetical protein